MNEQRTITRTALLKVLYDIEHGDWPTLVDKNGVKGEPVPFVEDMGTSGSTLCHYINALFPAELLTNQEIVADIDYLQQKHLITGKPRNPPGRSKVDKFKLLWVSITAYGKDVIEGIKREPSMPKIEQHIVHISNISNSPMAIGSPQATINQTINHAESDSVSNILSKIEAEIAELPSEYEKIAQALLGQLKGELLLESTQQDKGIINKNLSRINTWLSGLAPVATNSGKLLSLFKEIGGFFK